MIQEIKNSIRECLYKNNKDIIFHFEEVKHTGFPFVCLKMTNFEIEPAPSCANQKNTMDFSLVCQKSKENSISELFEFQKEIKNALMPVITVKNKKITPEDVHFSVNEQKLFASFRLTFYTFEIEDGEPMGILDVTLKENK